MTGKSGSGSTLGIGLLTIAALITYHQFRMLAPATRAAVTDAATILGAIALCGVVIFVGQRLGNARRTTPVKAAPVPGQGSPVLRLARPDQDVFMTYRDSSGHDTSRQVTIKGVDGHYSADGTPHIDLIHGYCHARKMARSFRTDRIRALADAETGEVIGSLEAWLGVQRKH